MKNMSEERESFEPGISPEHRRDDRESISHLQSRDAKRSAEGPRLSPEDWKIAARSEEIPEPSNGGALQTPFPLPPPGYRILSEIGDGVRASVFMAKQVGPANRLVALKILRGEMTNKTIIARFRAEQSAVARSHHPSIAQVFDAGVTEERRGYVASELVRGVAITDYCEQSRCILSERLGLVIEVCRAIQHAHQRGIIHRAIKPENVVIVVRDGIAYPRILDFGHAQAAEEGSGISFGSNEAGLGRALAYMSPEHADWRAIDMDTRSDIYSLGALLYELLLGVPPFGPQRLSRQNPEERRRTIREVVPQRLSLAVRGLSSSAALAWAQNRQAEPQKLAGEMAGTVEGIVMRCLEKDRTRRYESAIELARELESFRRSARQPEPPVHRLGSWMRGIFGGAQSSEIPEGTPRIGSADGP